MYEIDYYISPMRFLASSLCPRLLRFKLHSKPYVNIETLYADRDPGTRHSIRGSLALVAQKNLLNPLQISVAGVHRVPAA